MHEAAQRGETRQLQQLIESGACVNQVTVDSITPLHAASLQGQVQCVQLLLAAGAQVSHPIAQTPTPTPGMAGQALEEKRLGNTAHIKKGNHCRRLRRKGRRKPEWAVEGANLYGNHTLRTSEHQPVDWLLGGHW